MMLVATISLLAGFGCAYVVLRADLARRRLRIGARTIFLWLVVAGLAGAAVGRVLENPAALSGHTSAGLFHLSTLARSAGALTGILALFFLARRHNIRLLVLLDVASPAATLGITADRLVSFLPAFWPKDFGAAVQGMGSLAAAQQSYWTPVVILAGVTVFYFLWREGRRAIQFQRPEGIVVSEFLVITGLLGFWVGFFRTGSRGASGLTSVQAASLAWTIAGGVLLAVVLRRYFTQKEEHRILQRFAEEGDAIQPEYTPATSECPHPERWQMLDSMTAEVEVMDFLKSLVITMKPELIVETGTFMGLSAIKMAEGLKANGFGKLITCEFDTAVFAKAKERIEASGLGKWIEFRNESSLEMRVDGTIDIFFSDSHLPIREQEVRRFLPQINPHGLILAHDASSHYKIVREAALRLEKEGLLSVVLLPTPRGLMVAQKREGRK